MRSPRRELYWSVGRARRRFQYGTYMHSREWFGRRELWVEQFKATHEGRAPVCVVCGARWTLRRGDLHHRSYARLRAEQWRDLIPICRPDHRALHVLMEHDPAWRRIPREQATDLIVRYLRGKVGQQ
jgi:hypothetical protein